MADETLIQDRDDGRGNEPFGDSELNKTNYGTERVFGMQGRKNQMTGKCRLSGNLCGFRIPDFANEDDVGILSENRTYGNRIREPP